MARSKQSKTEDQPVNEEEEALEREDQKAFEATVEPLPEVPDAQPVTEPEEEVPVEVVKGDMIVLEELDPELQRRKAEEEDYDSLERLGRVPTPEEVKASDDYEAAIKSQIVSMVGSLGIAISTDPVWEGGYKYFDLVGLSPRKLMELYSKQKRQMFFSLVEKKGKKDEFNSVLDTEKVALYFSKVYYAKTFRDNGDVYVWDGVLGIYTRGETVVNSWLAEVLPEYATTSLFREVLNFVRAKSYVERDAVSINVDRIPFRNGDLVMTRDMWSGEISSLKLEQPSPEYVIFNRLPVNYLPEAKCPVYDGFLNAILHVQDIPLVNEMFGSMLDRRIVDKKSFWFYGPANTGKSTLFEAGIFCLGRMNVCSVPISKMNERFELSVLENRMANLVLDMGSDYVSNLSTFKSIVSGDPVRVEEKGKQPHMMYPYAKIAFALNTLPELKDRDDATWIRIRIVKVDKHQFTEEEMDREIKDKLYREADAIVSARWVPALVDYLNRGHYANPVPWERTRDLWEAETDPMSAWWLTSGFQLVPDGVVKTDTLVDSANVYMKMANRSSISAKSLGWWMKKRFGRQVTLTQTREEDGSRPYAYKGIGVVEIDKEDGKQ